MKAYLPAYQNGGTGNKGARGLGSEGVIENESSQFNLHFVLTPGFLLALSFLALEAEGGCYFHATVYAMVTKLLG